MRGTSGLALHDLRFRCRLRFQAFELLSYCCLGTLRRKRAFLLNGQQIEWGIAAEVCVVVCPPVPLTRCQHKGGAFCGALVMLLLRGQTLLC